MVKLLGRKSYSSTLALSFLLATLPIAIGTPLQSGGNVSSPPKGQPGFNPIVSKRADRDDADDHWIPWPHAAILLPDEKIDQLPGGEKGDIAKVRAAKQGLLLKMRMKDLVEKPPTSGYFKPRAGRNALQTFRRFGWEVTKLQEPSNLASYGLNNAFEALGISTDANYWTSSKIEHTREGVNPVDETIGYPPTHAVFGSLFNLHDGVIVGKENFGPQHFAMKPNSGIPPNRIVPLGRWRDVVWLQRLALITHAAIQNPTPVEHVFMHGVVDTDSLKVFEMVTGKSERRVPKWPGLAYGLGDLQGLAALSAPDVMEVAEMLAQHKGNDGSRTIDRIQIFRVSPSVQCVYMHITSSAGPVVDESAAPGAAKAGPSSAGPANSGPANAGAGNAAS